MTNLEEIEARLQWTQQEELSVEQIDQLIKDLRAKKRALAPKTIRIPKTTRRARQITCMHCGKQDTRSNMEQVSRYEYQHVVCPVIHEPKVIKVDFQI